MLELTLTLAPAEGALVRLLGLIERRGFPLGAIQTRTVAAGLDVRLTLPQDGRPADVLLRQVQRLYDVRDARMNFVQHTTVAKARHVSTRSRVDAVVAARDSHFHPARGIPA